MLRIVRVGLASADSGSHALYSQVSQCARSVLPTNLCVRSACHLSDAKPHHAHGSASHGTGTVHSTAQPVHLVSTIESIFAFPGKLVSTARSKLLLDLTCWNPTVNNYTCATLCNEVFSKTIDQINAKTLKFLWFSWQLCHVMTFVLGYSVLKLPPKTIAIISSSQFTTYLSVK